MDIMQTNTYVSKMQFLNFNYGYNAKIFMYGKDLI